MLCVYVCVYVRICVVFCHRVCASCPGYWMSHCRLILFLTLNSQTKKIASIAEIKDIQRSIVEDERGVYSLRMCLCYACAYVSGTAMRSIGCHHRAVSPFVDVTAALIEFSSELQRSYDLAFSDQATREAFIKLIRELNPGVTESVC